MALTLKATESFSTESVFLRPRWEGEERVYESPFLSIHVPRFASPWDICEVFMRQGFLPPIDVVRQLHEEEVKEGMVAKRLWVLRGARRSAQAVEREARMAIRQVASLKQSVQRWRYR